MVIEEIKNFLFDEEKGVLEVVFVLEGDDQNKNRFGEIYEEDIEPITDLYESLGWEEEDESFTRERIDLDVDKVNYILSEYYETNPEELPILEQKSTYCLSSRYLLGRIKLNKNGPKLFNQFITRYSD